MTLLSHNNRVEARAKPFGKAVERWLRKFALSVVNEEIAKRRLAAKARWPADWARWLYDDGPVPAALMAKADKKHEEDLDAIFDRYGLRLARETANKTAKGQKVEYSPLVVRNWAQRNYFRGKKTRVTGIARQTRKMVRLAIQKIIADARRETPQPSAAEVGRRIRRAFAEGELPGMKAAISPARAVLIARTENVQAENTGIVSGYQATGVEELEWMAYKDGRSGNRHHERMDGKRVKIDEKFYNPATGVHLRYPGDPSAPISETANCRCTVGPVRSTRRRAAR